MLKGRFAQAVLAWVLGVYLSAVLRTTRWTLIGAEHVAPAFSHRATIVAFWHERLPMMPQLWRMAQHAGAPMGLRVLVSRHRDGQLIGALMRRFGCGLVYGSTSRGGPAGLRGCAEALAAGDHIVITPDGPRGPRRAAAPGVAQLAALSQAPVLPAAAQITRHVVLDSWDRLVVPLPFGRGVIVCGPAIAVPRDGWEATLPRIDAALNDAAAAADRALQHNPRGWAGLALGAWSAAATAAAPVLRLMLARRVAAGKEIAARLPERRGIDPTPRPPGRLLWMHAASVGETISILPILHELAAIAPQLHLLLTTGTVSSAEIAAARAPPGALHRFVPLDVPSWAARFLDHWRPDAACFVESELWPNILRAAARRAIPLALLNGRLSQPSFRAWRRAAPLGRHLLAAFSLIQARSPADADRFATLAGHAIDSPGDLKFAAPPLPADPAALACLRAALGNAPVWLAASIHPGEETIVLAAHALLLPDQPGLITILIPRHPRRGAEMAALHPMPRRSLADPPRAGEPYMADTLGELGLFYRLAACAFIGGSLIPHGGQNPLEGARLACPTAIGPHAQNFAQACDELHHAGALTKIADATDLAAWARAMLTLPSVRAQAAEAGVAAAQGWSDLPRRAAQSVCALLPP